MIKNHRNKSFDIYDEDDIEQEAWLIVLEKLPEFNIDRSYQKEPKKALEHWLNRILSNRLSNLHRDKYLVKQRMTKSKKERKSHNLLNALDIDLVIDAQLSYDISNNNEFFELILKNLTPYMLDVFEACLSGENVGNYYRHKLLHIIKELIKEWKKESD